MLKPLSNIDRNAALIILLWGIINLLQAYHTDLIDDEAYYWVFSRRPDWGYFNHPPAIAIQIWLGKAIFDGGLGVRLLTPIFSCLGLWLIYRILKPKDLMLFFALTFGLAIFHVLSFITVPDSPSYFSTCLYFFGLYYFVKRPSLTWALFLGISIAFMGYAKYQGILVLLFSLLPLGFLWRRWQTWSVPMFALLFFLPHLLWQYQWDWATIRFHLFDRMPEPWQWKFPLEYLGGQLLVFGPLISIPLIISILKHRCQDPFESSLKYTIIGSVVFFFIMAFNGRTEANWTSFLILPIIFLCYKYLEKNLYVRKWVIRLSSISLFLIAILRIYAAYDFLPKSYSFPNDFHGRSEWANKLEKISQDLPIIFYSSYQDVSQYMYHSGAEAFLISMDRNSGSQFMMWPKWELELQGQKVMNICNAWALCDKYELDESLGIKYRIIDDWRSFNYLKLRVLNPPEYLKKNAPTAVQIEIFNPLDSSVVLQASNDKNLILHTGIYEYNEEVESYKKNIAPIKLESFQRDTLETYLPPLAASGNFKYSASIEVPNQHIGKNATFYTIKEVEEK